MKEIDILRTSIVVLISIGGIIAAYFRIIHLLEQKFRDRIEDQIKQLTEMKVEIEKLKSKDDLQQLILDQLKKHVLDNLPAFYQVLEQKEKKK